MKFFFNNLFSFNTFQYFAVSNISAKIAMIGILLFASSVSTTLNADTRYRVKASDSLNRIVMREYPDSSLSKQQLMIAIFIRNPKAFRKGDINLLMRGRRLVLPSEDKLEIVSQEDAKAILKRGTKSFQREILGGGKLLTHFELSDLSRQDLEILSGEQPSEYIAGQQGTPNEQTAGQTTKSAEVPQKIPQQQSGEKIRKKDNGNNREKKALIKTRKELSLAQKKLKKIEDERERLRAQLEKLTNEKKQADQQLLTLEEKLKQSNEQVRIQKAIQVANVEIKKQEAKAQEEIVKIQDNAKTLPEDVIAEDKKKRELEEKVKARTEKLKEANVVLQQKLQQTRSELAENTRENITLSRELNTLKEKPSAQNNSLEAHSVAEEIGTPKHSEKTLESADISANNAIDKGLGKLIWLFPVLLFFAALWFLLRRFLGAGNVNDTPQTEGEIYATPAFESNDDIDADYEEASLETSIKLDVARAYLEADDRDSAFEMLQEVIDEGDAEQQQEARDIMASYS